MPYFRMGIDIGGTFTDFCLYDGEQRSAHIHKQLTSAEEPSVAVVDGFQRLLADADVDAGDLATVVHGTTLVTNAVIERRGAPTALVVTRGFGDVVDIARERRYDLFDLSIRFPPPIVPRRLRFEVPGRLRADGSVIEDLDMSVIEAELALAVEEGEIESIAVCLLHSYANPAHETEAVAWLRDRFPDLKVSSSADVFPFMREYERWTTTCLNAYVQPVTSRYLDRLEVELRQLGFHGQFLIMNSAGGTLTTAMARRYPIRMLESGPAAGALMAADHGRKLGIGQLLSFDMGGTTAKGCIVRNGAPLKRYEMEVARVHEFKRGSGLPVRIPVLDMIEIGAGGGSVATLDERRLIRVGPESAGAEPGPACYDRGGALPTLTDANLVLGYLGAESFLGGEMRLNTAVARKAIQHTHAAALGIDVVEAAWGIHEVINEDVARAFRIHASESGVDYRRCSMVVFGGSGPVHGARIARKLRIPHVICPLAAGVMSAFGLLSSPIGFEIVRTRRVGVADLADDVLDAELGSLGAEASNLLADAGIGDADVRCTFRLDMRYEGQGYEIEVPVCEDPGPGRTARLLTDFETEYERLFGLKFQGRGIEIVNWKAEAQGPSPNSDGSHRVKLSRPAATKKEKGEREAWLPETGCFLPWPIYDRYALRPGDTLEGPALVEETESTCVVHEGDRLMVDANLNLVIDIGHL